MSAVVWSRVLGLGLPNSAVLSPEMPALPARGDAAVQVAGVAATTSSLADRDLDVRTGQAAASPTSDPPRDSMRVANTDGLGVVLRTAPSDGARVPRGLMEGTRVTVLDRSGDAWVLVRAENGQEGWVPPRYLAPLS